MNEKETKDAVAVASIRLSVIQPAFNGTFPDMSKKAYYDRIAAKPLKLPDGREVRYSPGTFACWESAAAWLIARGNQIDASHPPHSLLARINI